MPPTPGVNATETEKNPDGGLPPEAAGKIPSAGAKPKPNRPPNRSPNRLGTFRIAAHPAAAAALKGAAAAAAADAEGLRAAAAGRAQQLAALTAEAEEHARQWRALRRDLYVGRRRLKMEPN